jgi:signal transduction histidine kinase
MWDIELPSEPGGAAAEVYQFTPVGGPTLIVLSQLIRNERSDGSDRTFAVSVAEERTNEDDPVTTFGRALATFLSILAMALVGAAALQVYFGLKPLTTLREHIAAVRDGAAERLPVGASQELRPLTEQVNELLDAQEASMNFVRERASDLAHGLKTPLAVLGATADRLVKQGDTSSAETLRLLVDQMNERVDYQLRIARLRLRTRAQGVHGSINEAVLRSISVLRNAPDGQRINWLVDLEDSLDVSIDRHDLMEFIGILLENAQQWASQKVSVHGRRVGDRVDLLVEDDGKGLGDEQIARLGKRGVRLDESRDGDGLGLAIAFEICRMNSAEISLGRSDLGGLKVETRFAI